MRFAVRLQVLVVTHEAVGRVQGRLWWIADLHVGRRLVRRQHRLVRRQNHGRVIEDLNPYASLLVGLVDERPFHQVVRVRVGIVLAVQLFVLVRGGLTVHAADLDVDLPLLRQRALELLVGEFRLVLRAECRAGRLPHKLATSKAFWSSVLVPKRDDTADIILLESSTFDFLGRLACS